MSEVGDSKNVAVVMVTQNAIKHLSFFVRLDCTLCYHASLFCMFYMCVIHLPINELLDGQEVSFIDRQGVKMCSSASLLDLYVLEQAVASYNFLTHVHLVLGSLSIHDWKRCLVTQSVFVLFWFVCLCF